MKKKITASVLVVGSLITQSVLPIYATNIQKVNPYNTNTAVSTKQLDKLYATVIGIEGYSELFELPIGNLNAETITSPIEGYDFANVKVGNTEITSIGTYTDPETQETLWYYSTDGINATIFDDDSVNQITIEFKIHVNSYNVTYSHDETVSVEGPEKLEEGENLSFTLNLLNTEYIISQVLVNGNDYTSQLNKNTLTISSDNIKEDLNIEIITKEAVEYNVTYDENFLMNGSISGEQANSVVKGQSYTLEFWSSEPSAVPRHGWILNQVRVNGHELYLPSDTQSKGSKSDTYDFGNGMTAVIEVTDSKYSVSGVGNYYKFRLTITNVKSDINVEKINFKNSKRHEVINRNIDYFNDIDNWYAEDHEWKYTDITKKDNVIENVSENVDDTMNYPQFIFVDLTEGYDETTVKAYLNDSDTDSTTLLPISEIQNIDFGKYDENVKKWLMQTIEDAGKNYTHFIQVPAGKDVKFSYDVQKSEYSVVYDLDGGSWSYGGDTNTYDYFENSIVKIPNLIPTKKGYSFVGWKIGNSIYSPRQYIDITSDNDFYTSAVNNQFKLKAIWVKDDEVDQDTYWNYFVVINEQTADGYKTIATSNYTARKSVGSNPRIILSNIVETMKSEKGYTVPYGFEEQYKNLNTVIENGQTFEVKVKAIDYNIEYIGLPGTSTSSNPKKYNIFSSDITLANPTDASDDYVVFDGWYSDDKYENKITDISINKSDLKDITVYARYLTDKNNDDIPDENQKVIIKFDANGGKNPPEDLTCLTGESYKMPAKGNMTHPDDYAFAGWTTNKIDAPVTEKPKDIIFSGSELSQTTNGEYTYYAVWAADNNGNGTPDYEEDKYHLIYDANGGIGAPTDNKLYLSGKKYNLSSVEPTKENAVFYGWSLTKDETLYEEEPDFKPVTEVTFRNSDISVYAVWLKDTDGDGTPDYEETKYTLTYNANGGENAPTDNKKYVNKETVELSKNYPTRDKAACIGWSTTLHEGILSAEPDDIIDKYTFGEANATVYAVWAIDNDENGTPDYEQTFNLQYDTNGGTAIAPTEHKGGEEVELDDKNPTKENAIFLGWSLQDYSVDFEEDPTDVEFVDSIVIDASKDNIVHAVWAVDKNNDGVADYEEDKYTLAYDTNGGTPIMSTQHIKGTTVSLQDKKPTKEKAIFLGWSLNDYNDDFTSVPDDVDFITNYVFSMTSPTDATVHAVWAVDDDEDGTPDYEEMAVVTVEIYAGNVLSSSTQVEQSVGSSYGVAEIADTITYNGQIYVYDRIENNNITVSINDENNIIRIHYQLQQGSGDSSDPVNPGGPTDSNDPTDTGNLNDNPNDDSTLPNTDNQTDVNVTENPRTPAANAGTVTNQTGTDVTGDATQDRTDTDQNVDDEEIIEDNEVPQAGTDETQNIEDNQTPLAGKTDDSSWSIVDLILTLLSIVFMILTFIKKRETIIKAISGAAAVASTIVFILTQDLTAKMIMFDTWTILFVIAIIVQAASYILSRKEKEKDEE